MTVLLFESVMSAFSVAAYKKSACLQEFELHRYFMNKRVFKQGYTYQLVKGNREFSERSAVFGIVKTVAHFLWTTHTIL